MIAMILSLIYILFRCPNIKGILTPTDEFTFWAEMASAGRKSEDRDRAAALTEVFNPLAKACLFRKINLIHVYFWLYDFFAGICWLGLLFALGRLGAR